MLNVVTQNNVPLSALTESESPLRREPSADRVAQMARSLAQEGQRAPLVVTPSGHETYKVIDGRLRLQAFLQLKREGYPLDDVVVWVSDERAALALCADNNLGRGLSPAEQAINVRALENETDGKHLGVSFLADGRRAGHQHMPRLNALVRERLGVSRESARKACYRACVPINVLYEVLNTQYDKAELLTRCGKAAVRAREKGIDPEAAARTVMAEDTHVAVGDRWLSVERIATALRDLDPCEAEHIGVQLGSALPCELVAGLIAGLRRSVEPDRQQEGTEGASDKAGGCICTDKEPQQAADRGSKAGSVTPTANEGDRRGAGHTDGGPEGGVVDLDRAENIRDMIESAMYSEGGLGTLSDLTGVPKATLSQIRHGRSPCERNADSIERVLSRCV